MVFNFLNLNQRREVKSLLDIFGENGGGETGLWNQRKFGANRNLLQNVNDPGCPRR